MPLKRHAPVLAILLLGVLAPGANAIVANQVPLGLLVTIESNPANPTLMPVATWTPGWHCVVTQPWTHGPGPAGPQGSVEYTCTPIVPPPPFVEWVCRNIGVIASAEGLGSVSGVAQCGQLVASCTATAVGTRDVCGDVAKDSSPPPLVCQAFVLGAVARWRVDCFNDP